MCIRDSYYDSAKQAEMYDNLIEVVETEPEETQEPMNYSEEKTFIPEYQDVYKRQPLHTAFSAVVLCCRPYSRRLASRFRAFPDGRICECEPVSYTHLDVYKRQ